MEKKWFKPAEGMTILDPQTRTLTANETLTVTMFAL